MAAGDPANHDQQGDLMVSNAILGRTLALCGKLDVALRYTNDAVSSAKAAAGFDPTGADLQEYAALYSQQLGGLLRQAGRLDEAAAADTESTAIFAKLAIKDASHTDWQKEYAQARIEAARLQLQQGDAAGAQSLADAALQTLDTLRSKHGSDQTLALLAAQGFVVLGEIAAKRGDAAAAHAAWSKASDAIAPALRAGDDPNALATAASALLLLDETDKARPLIAKLAAMGYHTPDFAELAASRQFAYAPDPAVAQRINGAMR
jgi:tetratricopeptide (TPR) repeat protein